MLAVTGMRSRIVEELRKLLPPDEEVVGIPGGTDLADLSNRCQRYFLCAGVLRPKQIWQQSAEELDEGLRVNLITPLRICDLTLRYNDRARIVVMGSESGFSWSYDGAYAAAKAALHRYVETKKLRPHQQLVAVAPSIISDCGMTERREDVDNLKRRMDAHPKNRFLRAIEVARMVHFLLYVDEGYTTSTVIRMNGGGS